MKPIIIEQKIFKLLGCVFYGDPFHEAEEWTYENEIGKLWERFGKSFVKYASLLKRISTNWNIGYELHLEPAEYKKTKNYYVMVGMEVNNIDEIPLEMFVKILPKVDYVKFTTTIENKDEEGMQVFKNWIPENGLEQAYPFIIESYDQNRYKGLDNPNSEIDWFIPIRKIK